MKDANKEFKKDANRESMKGANKEFSRALNEAHEGTPSETSLPYLSIVLMETPFKS